MADDNTFRSYRPDDPYRRAAEPARPSDADGGDPLAELARLIGQSDPFAEFGARRAPQRQEDTRAAAASRARRTDTLRRTTTDDVERHDASAHQRRSAAASTTSASSAFRRHDYGRSQDSDRQPILAAARMRRGSRCRRPPISTQYPRLRDQRAARRMTTDLRRSRKAYAAIGAAIVTRTDRLLPGRSSQLEPHETRCTTMRRVRAVAAGSLRRWRLIGCAVLGTAGAYALSQLLRADRVPRSRLRSSRPTIRRRRRSFRRRPAIRKRASSIQDRVATAGKEQLVSKQEEPVAVKEPGHAGRAARVLPRPGRAGHAADCRSGNSRAERLPYLARTSRRRSAPSPSARTERM